VIFIFHYNIMPSEAGCADFFVLPKFKDSAKYLMWKLLVFKLI